MTARAGIGISIKAFTDPSLSHAWDAVMNQYGYTENYKNVGSDITELQAVTLNAATSTTWALKTQAAAFDSRVSMGPAANGTDVITDAQVKALDDTADGESYVTSTVARTYSAIQIESGEYLWFCHPDAISDLATIKDETTGFAVADTGAPGANELIVNLGYA